MANDYTIRNDKKIYQISRVEIRPVLRGASGEVCCGSRLSSRNKRRSSPPLIFKPLLDLLDEFSHVHRPKQERLEAAAFEAAFHAQGVARDDPDGDASRPDRQRLDICRGVVACRYVSNEKRRKGKGPFELRQGFLNRLIGLHAGAFLDQLRSK